MRKISLRSAVVFVIALAIAAFSIGALAGSAHGATKTPTAKAAVVGWEARSIAKQVVTNDECGKISWFWRCNHVSNAVCRGGGGGTWHCYLPFSEYRRLTPWVIQVCDSYVYVNRSGGTTNPNRYNCKRV